MVDMSKRFVLTLFVPIYLIFSVIGVLRCRRTVIIFLRDILGMMLFL